MIMIMIGWAGAEATWIVLVLVLSASPSSHPDYIWVSPSRAANHIYPPPWLLLAIWSSGHLASWILLTWSRMELEGFASLVQALGIRPLMFGSSGTFSKNISSLVLKSSTLHFVMFLTDSGIQLKSWGPFAWKDCSLKLCIPFLAWVWILGIWHFLPALPPSSLISMPQLGAMPSKIFHVYIILYLSNLLCRDNIFILANCSH